VAPAGSPAGGGRLRGVEPNARPFAPAPAPCADPVARRVDVWDAGVRGLVASAFAATKTPFASDALARVEPLLDNYGSQWRAMHIETCTTARAARTGASELLDRRMTCLDQRLDALRSLTTTFADANAAVVTSAVESAYRLPPMADCADTSALLASMPMPGGVEHRAKIMDLGRRLADLRAYRARGEPAEFLRRAIALEAEARSIDYLPLLVTAILTAQYAQRDARIPSEGRLRELVAVAAAARDDRTLTLAWGSLVFELTSLGRLDEARALEPVALAALARAGSPPALILHVETGLGKRAVTSGDYDSATEHGRRALDVAQSPVERRSALLNLAAIASERGAVHDALPLVQQALAAGEEAHGKHHPNYAATLHIYGIILQQTGDAADLPRARTAFEEALRIQTAAFGERHPVVALTLRDLAGLFDTLQQSAEAERMLRRAVAIQETVGTDPDRIATLQSLADAINNQRGLDEARPFFERALALAEKTVGTETFDYVVGEVNFAQALPDRDCTAARRYAVHAAAYLRKIGNPSEAMALAILARCDEVDGNHAGSIKLLERGIELCSGGGCSPGNLEHLELTLGQQLVEAGRDRARGLQLVAKARAGSVAIGRDDDVKEIDAWLRKQRR